MTNLSYYISTIRVLQRIHESQLRRRNYEIFSLKKTYRYNNDNNNIRVVKFRANTGI